MEGGDFMPRMTKKSPSSLTNKGLKKRTNGGEANLRIYLFIILLILYAINYVLVNSKILIILVKHVI